MEIALEKDKITVALLWPRYGGEVTSVNDLVVGLKKDRFKAVFIFLSGYGVGKNILEEAGYEVFYLSNARRIPGFRLSILFRLVKILKEHHVDVLHCHRHKPTVYGVIAAVFAHTPVVMSHVHGMNRSRNFRRKLLNFVLFRKISRIVTVANSVKEDVLRYNWFLSSEKVFVLENSVDYERFSHVSTSKEDARKRLGLASEAVVFGTVGRLAPTKGQVYLIEAFAKVKRKLPGSVLLLVGAGRLENVLKREASKAGFVESIHFLGQRDDVPQILRAFDVFVFPSINEAFGLALAEAMVAEIPCIATWVGGIPEVTNGDETCILVPPRDSEALAETMLRVAKMRGEELAEVIEKARDRVRRFYSHDVVREKLRDLYLCELGKVVRKER
jgi:glycosyltransferase involved in cell wall biosynthesis